MYVAPPTFEKLALFAASAISSRYWKATVKSVFPNLVAWAIKDEIDEIEEPSFVTLS